MENDEVKALEDYMEKKGLDEQSNIEQIVREKEGDINLHPVSQTSVSVTPPTEKVTLLTYHLEL